MQLVVIGCGRVGAGLAQALDEAGHGVAVVDPNEEALHRLPTRFGGRFLAGDPLERGVLQESGLERADGLAVVTDSDDLNLALALAARRIFRVPRVVARLHAPGRAGLYQRLGVHTLSALAGGIRRLQDLLTLSPLHPVASLGQVDLVEVHVTPTLLGRPLRVLEVPGEVHVVALTREGATHLVSPEVPLAEGDVIQLAVREPSLARLRALLGLE